MSAPIQAVVIPVTPFQQNCSLLWCTLTRRAAFIDPGGDLDLLVQTAQNQAVKLEKILITHGHIDHCGQAGILARRLGLPIEGPHVADRFWIDQAGMQGASFGLQGETFTPDRWLNDGDVVTVGTQSLEVVHCPGHTPGHVVFIHRQARVAFVGDVLFQGSIGRTDFPQGNHADLIASITQKLWPYGDDIRFVPGHGSLSTFGAERQSNPFVADRVLQEN